MLCSYNLDLIQDETHLILVTVEPEGFPAKQHVPERQFIIFNIGNILHTILIILKLVIESSLLVLLTFEFIWYILEYSSTDSSITIISCNANFPCSIVHLLIHQCAMNCC
jgi:hypothetical protein